jgi:uncharacterized membrane protein YphA (DoxX/SURF4 family)
MRNFRIKSKMRSGSIVVLRVGIGLVIAWFGLQQVSDPSSWISYLPPLADSLPTSQINLIYINGWFEIVFGVLLVTGFYVRLVAFLLAIHLAGIVYTIGYNEIGVRDFGLLVALVAIFLHGPNK